MRACTRSRRLAPALCASGRLPRRSPGRKCATSNGARYAAPRCSELELLRPTGSERQHTKSILPPKHKQISRIVPDFHCPCTRLSRKGAERTRAWRCLGGSSSTYFVATTCAGAARFRPCASAAKRSWLDRRGRPRSRVDRRIEAVRAGAAGAVANAWRHEQPGEFVALRRRRRIFARAPGRRRPSVRRDHRVGPALEHHQLAAARLEPADVAGLPPFTAGPSSASTLGMSRAKSNSRQFQSAPNTHLNRPSNARLARGVGGACKAPVEAAGFATRQPA